MWDRSISGGGGGWGVGWVARASRCPCHPTRGRRTSITRIPYPRVHMCGIGGILRVWPAEQREVALRTPHVQSIPERWLDILDDAVQHRGPDGHGRFRDR